MNHEYRREWIGESGYCNCLLVAMSRAPIGAVELFSDRQLPNLETLVSSRADTAAWIRAQAFDYPSLIPSAVIAILMESAGMSRLPWGRKTGTISVVDCVGDEGPEVQREFTLRLSKASGASRLLIELLGVAAS
jgi:hypothetical protein